MRFLFPAAIVVFLSLGVLAGPLAWGAQKEKDDLDQLSGAQLLDQATSAKLTADSLSDLAGVIRLLEKAMEKGLDESGQQFAKELLSATRIQRGTVLSQAIFGTVPPDPNWRDYRRLALEDLEKGVAITPNQPQAFLAIAQLNLLPGGDTKRVRSALDEAIRTAGTENEPLVKVKALLMRAGLTEDAQKKLADLDEAVRTAPGNVAGLRARGAWYFDQRKFSEALADFNAALKVEPQNAALLAARGLVLAELKRYDEAMADFTKAHELEPKAAAPLLQIGRLHGIRGKYKEALEALDQAHILDPGNAGVLLLRASVFQQLDEKDKALADVDRVLKLRPGLPMAMQLRAALLAGSNKFEEAIAQLEALQRTTPEDSDVDLQLAMFYNLEGRPRKAVELFSKVLAKESTNFIALRGRADALLAVGKQAEAIADYETALKVRPDDSGVLNNLAWVLATSPDEKLRDGKRSIELATKACKLTDYKQAHILSTLAAGYAETGDFATAIKWSQKAVEQGKDDQKEALAKELASYKENKPVREIQNTPEREEPTLPTLEPPKKSETPAQPSAQPAEPAKPAEPKAAEPAKLPELNEPALLPAQPAP
ncbi:MAG: tetratricopeptide repeat protein [Thermoguttaceae bacterium]